VRYIESLDENISLLFWLGERGEEKAHVKAQRRQGKRSFKVLFSFGLVLLV